MNNSDKKEYNSIPPISNDKPDQHVCLIHPKHFVKNMPHFVIYIFFGLILFVNFILIACFIFTGSLGGCFGEKDNIIDIAIFEKNETLCNKIKAEDVKEECFKQISLQADQDLLERALAEEDDSLCGQITTAEIKKACLSQLNESKYEDVLEKAVTSTDSSLCEGIEGSDAKTSCVKQIELNQEKAAIQTIEEKVKIAFDTKNVDICKEFEIQADQDQCVEIYNHKVEFEQVESAVEAMDSALCGAIKTAKMKEGCLKMIQVKKEQ